MKEQKTRSFKVGEVIKTKLAEKCWEATKKTWVLGIRYEARKDGRVNLLYEGKIKQIITEEELEN